MMIPKLSNIQVSNKQQKSAIAKQMKNTDVRESYSSWFLETTIPSLEKKLNLRDMNTNYGF